MTPDRVAKIIAQVFDRDPTKVTDDDSPDSIAEWTSMGHVNLVVALEQEFEISISPEEAEDMLSVKLIRAILREKRIEP